MYNFTSDDSVARRNRAFTAENLSLTLPAGVEALPEAQLFQQLVLANELLDRHVAESQQRWAGFFGEAHRDGGLGPVPRTLRIAVYSLHARQDMVPGRTRNTAVTAADGPSWTLRVQGKLLPEAGDGTVKLSHFVRRITVEVLPGKEPDSVVVWSNERLGASADGFELTRPGRQDVPVRVTVDLDYPVALMTVPPSLRAVLGGTELDTLDGVLRRLWRRCAALPVDSSGRWMLDGPLQTALRIVRLSPAELAPLVRSVLGAPAPLVVEHVVRVSGAPEDNMQCFDVTVREPDAAPVSSRAANVIRELDCEAAAALDDVAASALRRAALLALARDPGQLAAAVARGRTRDDQFEAAAGALSQATFQDSPYLEEAASQLLKKRLRLDGSSSSSASKTKNP